MEVAEKFEALPEEIKPLVGHLFDPKNALSLPNMIPGKVPGILLDLLLRITPLWSLLHDETLLKKELRANYGYQPSVNDHRLRYLFWVEYENALLESRKMHLPNVHSLVCNEMAFKGLFLKEPHRTAFLVSRPAAYQQTLREMLLHGMGRLRDILDLPETDERGKINTKVLELKLKVVAMVDMRLHGAPTQKVHQITQNLPAANTAKGQEVQQLVHTADMGAIKKRLEKLENEKRKLEGREASKPADTMEPELVPAAYPKSNNS